MIVDSVESKDTTIQLIVKRNVEYSYESIQILLIIENHFSTERYKLQCLILQIRMSILMMVPLFHPHYHYYYHYHHETKATQYIPQY